MSHIRTRLKETITIEQMITMYYFEFGSAYAFRGEKHDFWEFLYVDKGEVDVYADEKRVRLQQGTIIFHKPNEFHRFHANQVTAPNVIVMSFDCRSSAMEHFEDRIIRLEDEERNLLASIIEEGTHAFGYPLRYPLLNHRMEKGPIGSEQMIKLYLETFLIRLLRRISAPAVTETLSSTMKENNDEKVVKAVIDCLEMNIGSTITLDEISQMLHISKTRLKPLFKKWTGLTVMEYVSNMRIDKAKVLIREGSYNFTEIAEMIGYGSVHTFSKMFKKSTSMNPTEYAKSVKGRVKMYANRGNKDA